jgi:Holliday junction resolvase-like predicted endonuclease
MKVSFGMGMAARVPWISFTAPGISASNGYFPVYLYYKEQNVLVLSYGISETSQYPVNWNREIQESNELISEVVPGAARYGDSYVFRTYIPEINGTTVVFNDANGKNVNEGMAQDLTEILNTYRNTLDLEVKDETSVVSSGLFYMEKQLEEFIIENWNESEFGKSLDLIYEDGLLKCQQYRTDIGIIDILAKDKVTGSYVVIELKRNQTSDDTVGQVLRYMGWVTENLKEKNVRGIIVAGTYDEKLYYAQNMIQAVDVFLYEVQFKLKAYKK